MVKQGYKKTEVGVIPEDWSCAKIEDIATILMCKRIFADQTTENGEIPFYKIGTFGKEADAYISRSLYNEYRNRFSFPKKGDVLISAAGTLGRTVVYDGKDAYFQDSNIVWLDIDKNVLCNEYLNHYYRVIKWASSEGSTIARLGGLFLIDVRTSLKNEFVYSEKLESVYNLPQTIQPGNPIVLFGSVSEGGYTVNYREGQEEVIIDIQQADLTVYFTKEYRLTEFDANNHNSKYFLLPILYRTSTGKVLL